FVAGGVPRGLAEARQVQLEDWRHRERIGRRRPGARCDPDLACKVTASEESVYLIAAHERGGELIAVGEHDGLTHAPRGTDAAPVGLHYLRGPGTSDSVVEREIVGTQRRRNPGDSGVARHPPCSGRGRAGRNEDVATLRHEE